MIAIILGFFVCIAIVAVGLWCGWRERKKIHEQALRDLASQQKLIDEALKIAEGPFYSPHIRFPRKMMQYSISGEMVRHEFHIHKLTPKSAIHLLHVLKEFTDIPRSCMIAAAHMDINRDSWTITVMDDSFPELESGCEVATGSLTFYSREGVRLETECPECLANAMANTPKTFGEKP